MPYVNVQITKGASRSEKAELVRQITQTLQDVLGKNPAYIHVVIQEFEPENWGFSGMLTDDFRKLKAESEKSEETATRP